MTPVHASKVEQRKKSRKGPVLIRRGEGKRSDSKRGTKRERLVRAFGEDREEGEHLDERGAYVCKGGKLKVP